MVFMIKEITNLPFLYIDMAYTNHLINEISNYTTSCDRIANESMSFIRIWSLFRSTFVESRKVQYLTNENYPIAAFHQYIELYNDEYFP